MPKRIRQGRSASVPLVLAVAVAMAFALWQTRENSRLAGEVRAARNESQAVQTQQLQKIQEQEAQIVELSEVLQLSTEKLQQATAALTNRPATVAEAAPVARPAPPPLSAEVIEHLQAQVKAPVVETELDSSGEETRSFTFPELVSPEGELHGTDMKFSRQYGSKLAFRSSSGLPVTFEVDELHPGILTHLGIDPYEAQRAQDEMNEKAARRKEAQRERELARHKAQAEALKERMALAKELRKEAFDRQARLAALENERTKALAAMKQADAAMIEAQKPPTTLINPGITTGFGVQSIVVPAEPTVNGPQAPNSVGQRAPISIQTGTSPNRTAPVFRPPSRQARLPGQLNTTQ